MSQLPPRCGPLAPDTSVRIDASRSDVPRGAMLRLATAAGAAADQVGGFDRVEVELSCDGAPAPVEARRGDGRLHVRVHLRDVTSTAALVPLLAGAARASTPGPSTSSPDDRGHRRPARVVLLHNPFRDPDRPGEERPDMAVGTFQLASALHMAGLPHDLVEGAYHPIDGFDELDGLGALGADALLGLTLLEGCFGAVRALTDQLEADPTVAVGGPMATWTPLHVMAHLPGAHLVVRGDGEGVLPKLARLLRGAPDATAQEAILDLDGVMYLRRGLLLAGHLGRVNRFEIDETAMAFDLLDAAHVSRGLSLETGRGCAHGCAFCTTPGRGAYRGRSAAVIARHLQRYRERLTELFGDAVPDVARRVQICDDDFACDPQRAVEILGVVAESGLQLAAFQASVGDFLDRRAGGLREDLLEAIHPGLFQDGERHAALARGPIVGQLPRHMGSAVHLGVESFADAELRRLGKGYTAAEACEVVAALGRRGIVHDVYLILGNRGTTLENLVETLLALARLKVEHPHTFFVRIPVVPFVVPTAPSVAYELARRKGASLDIGHTWTLADFAEFDYPMVARELPDDLDARAVCEDWERFVEADPGYLAPARNLRYLLTDRMAGARSAARTASLRRAIRRLHTVRRRTIYRGLALARRRQMDERLADRYWRAAGDLGPAEQVAAEARNALEVGDPRLVVIPTRDCSLRCSYCPADKQPGLEMSAETLSQSVELLLSADAPRVILQFFGGEALLQRDRVLTVMDQALGMARSAGKQIGFIVSTNGVSLDPGLIERLASLPVKVEISLDGDRSVHDRHRHPKAGGPDSYDLVTRFAPLLIDSGIPHEVIMVVTPDTVASLCDSFAHVVSLGFRRIQINNGLAMAWSRGHKEVFAGQLSAIEQRFFAESLAGSGVEWINLRSFRDPMLLNGEITVDHDGTVYFGNGFLVRTADPGSFRAGHLDDLASFDSYVLRRPDNAQLLRCTYPEDLTRNNTEVGRIYGSFVRHMRARFPELAVVEPTRSPGGREGEGAA